MPTTDSPGFLAGVIEGFYGQPWAQPDRLELFRWMADWGLNTYFYGPKDDWKVRAIWRETYTDAEAEPLRELIRACEERNLHFVYALCPGLDIRYTRASDLDHLKRRCEQLHWLGCRNFAVLFDDIPDRMAQDDLDRFGTLASAQSQVANALFDWTRERSPQARFLFCPTPYCGRMAAAQLGGEGYLATIGKELREGIDIFWTGPEIISREITVAHVRELRQLLRRKPMIWDNLHANDYDGRRFFCGPYAGRPREIRQEVAGLLTNPNCEFPLNYVPFRTLAEFVRGEGPWDPRAAYLSALREWLPSFALSGPPITFEDLVLLGDCYYLPYEEGPQATALHDQTKDLLARNPAQWGADAAAFRTQASRLRDVCARMTELRQRTLFYALSRRLWELREEMDLLDRYVACKVAHPDPKATCGSDFHQPGTYRGGLVAKLQRLLVLQPKGNFTPAPPIS
jgi:protein O-GlcNAcase/histone acetyltransferase